MMVHSKPFIKLIGVLLLIVRFVKSSDQARVNTHMTSTLRRSLCVCVCVCVCVGIKMLADVGGQKEASVLDVQSLFFSLKKTGFAP